MRFVLFIIIIYHTGDITRNHLFMFLRRGVNVYWFVVFSWIYLRCQKADRKAAYMGRWHLVTRSRFVLLVCSIRVGSYYLQIISVTEIVIELHGGIRYSVFVFWFCFKGERTNERTLIGQRASQHFRFKIDI